MLHVTNCAALPSVLPFSWMEFLPDLLLPLPQRVVGSDICSALMPTQSSLLATQSPTQSPTQSSDGDSVADQSSTSRRLGFCASYEKIKYRAINTYVRYVPTIRDLAGAQRAASAARARASAPASYMLSKIIMAFLYNSRSNLGFY